MKIAIIGAGTWATALSQVLVDNGRDVLMYSVHENQVNEINNLHTNSKYFGHEVMLNPNIKASLSLEDCLNGALYILLAVPTIAIRSVLEKIIPLIKEPKVFINAAKGFDPETNKRITDVIRDVVPSSLLKGVVSIIGPGHAEEVIVRKLTCITSTSVNEDDALACASLFANDYFKVYTNTDEVGAEYGVAIKNAIAIASGILDGLGYGDNARAALVTRGLHEILRFGQYYGGDASTYMGLTGLGDLMVTCNSIHSRNFRAGVQIGKDDSAEFFLKHNEETTEGIRTARVVYELAKNKKIYMPIIDSVYRVLYEGAKPSVLVKELMMKPLKGEAE
ncbi:MAG: NAD(P)-dependent glycerol-3-phosphate dehydrogenase [Bacilli bacterium]|nr:NAD(P)-dependent glycerol-3-phosphate dehydrogenase [Bacilli bacterium]